MVVRWGWGAFWEDIADGMKRVGFGKEETRKQRYQFKPKDFYS